MSGVAPVSAAVVLCGLGTSAPLGPVAGAMVTRLDDAHAQFWPAWRSDAAAANISRANGDYDASWSEFSDSMPLVSARAQSLLAANTARYTQLAALAAAPLGGSEAAVVGADRCVRFTLELVAHGVALVELPGLV